MVTQVFLPPLLLIHNQWCVSHLYNYIINSNRVATAFPNFYAMLLWLRYVRGVAVCLAGMMGDTSACKTGNTEGQGCPLATKTLAARRWPTRRNPQRLAKLANIASIDC